MTQLGGPFGKIKNNWNFVIQRCNSLTARSIPAPIIEQELSEEAAPDPRFPFAVAKTTDTKLGDSAAWTPDQDDNMGKSNKFDYTNKGTTGVRLGQFIAKQLDSEADKAKKSAEREVVKARKQSISSGTGSSDCPDSFVHHIDLQVPSKQLNDDGLHVLADGLEIALRKGTDQASLALEDVNLSDNGLTTSSLARLAPVIELAKHDLKTLNLTNNDISVTSDKEVADWEVFLRAFRNCFRLRRLDLSGNVGLGARAMEIFAKVHIWEDAITPMPPGGDTSVYSLISNKDEEGDAEAGDLPRSGRNEDEAYGGSLSDGRMLRKRCGLRSIPFVTLQNIGLTDTGALWLSYVLEDHYYPNQLVDQLNATLHDSTIKAYQQDHGVNGIDWHGNAATLSKDGTLLLNKTESVRRQLMLDDRSTMAGSLIIEEPGDTADNVDQSIRRPMERRMSRAVPRDRRASIRSIHTIDGGEHEMTELESLRKKIQRHLIAEGNVASMDLWSSSLRLLHCTRVLLHAAPQNRKHYIGESLYKVPTPAVQPASIHQQSTPAFTPPTTSHRNLTVDTKKAAASAKPGRGSYAARLTASSGSTPGEPELALTDVTNTPTTPKTVFKAHSHRKGAFSEGTDLAPVTDKVNGLILRDTSPERFIRFQKNRIMATGLGPRAFRDSSVACHLPRKLIDYVASFAMRREELDVMSEEQRNAVLTWGLKRSTLMAEREWMKKDESYQVWMLLDSIKCLAYGQ